MNIFFEDEKCRYGLIDKRSFEFLEPKRGEDYVFEEFLFKKFNEHVKNFIIEENYYFTIENQNNLYLVVLHQKGIEYYIENGNEEEAQDAVVEFLGFLIGHLKTRNIFNGNSK